MVAEIPFVFLILILVFAGLYLSNKFEEYGVPNYLTRELGHIVAGLGYILCPFLFSSWILPLGLSGFFTIALFILKLSKSGSIRGIGGSARESAFAEVFLPLAGTVSIAIGWAWLDNPWLGILPILGVCFGDMMTSVLESLIYKREVKGNWSACGMLVTCLLMGFLFSPYWIAALGGAAGTATERFMPLTHGWVDDNWMIVAAYLAVMCPLWLFFG